MSSESESSRLLRTLRERDREVRALTSSPAFRASYDMQRQFRDLVAPSQRLKEQLSSQPYQRAIDIARQLSEHPLGITQHGRETSRDEPARPTPRGAHIGSVADLGQLVRRGRKAAKLTQAQFASHAGVGRRFVSELEGGKGSLEFDKVMACVEAAGIDITAIARKI